MSVVLIHGSDRVASLNKLKQITEKYPSLNISRACEEEITEHFLINNLAGRDFFGDEKLVILENPPTDIDLLKYPVGDLTKVVLFFDKELGASSLILKSEWIKGANIFHFELQPDRSIFQFLDLLAEKNPKALGEAERLLDEFGDQYLLTMIFYLFRRQVLPNKKIPINIARKLDEQKKNFPMERLEKFYQLALELDFKIKRGLMDGRAAIFWLVEAILKD